jgi:xanthine dehydrogenase molybdenum-binding subunit
MNMNMLDYKWRTFPELPRFQKSLLETPFDTISYGAIGFGEISTAPGPGAVRMAVCNAVGKWFNEYPLTPDRILKALDKIPGRKSGQEKK